jgi:hypothetical protein
MTGSWFSIPGSQFSFPGFRRAILFLPILAVFLLACGGGGGQAQPPTGPAQISTFAYVMSECELAPGQGQGPLHQALWIRQGERDPVKIVEFTLPTLPRSLCLKLGQARSGLATSLLGAFQRLGVTPEGSTLVFEVTDQFSLFRGFVPAQQKGFWVVRADGSGLRRIADPSREASFAVDWNCLLFGGTACSVSLDALVDFSLDDREFGIIDEGPDTSGSQAPQVLTLDLATGERTQLTFLPALPRCPRESTDPDAECVPVGQFPILLPRFLDAQTAIFSRRERVSASVTYTVDVQTKKLQPVRAVVVPGGGIVPIFQITGEAIGLTVNLPDRVPVNGPGLFGNIVTEAFAFDGTNLLQLTAFGRSDTTRVRTTLDGSRVLFIASADPLGTNPTNACEYFSIDPLGADLRQLTHLGASTSEGCNCQICNCNGIPCAPPICTISSGELDRGTGSIVFFSSCDPFGTNPYGEQAFAMRLDGTGLRHLTSARGMREGADGSLAVELAGPWAIARRFR